MSNYKYILFDFDGTLTDSSEEFSKALHMLLKATVTVNLLLNCLKNSLARHFITVSPYIAVLTTRTHGK